MTVEVAQSVPQKLAILLSGSIYWKTKIFQKNGDMFRITSKAKSSFNQAVLESIYINTKNPLLCRKKELVLTLGLHW